ncbi:hypothetical protein PR202_ga06351 [Eleusine coracana subsp. coracana]|uniref:Seven-in-absentia protein TRAF-like domain-containing protein n=1 Tax=Eleusine coracana subsp. coracana TaxID=191504 RepID=A0AAV5BX79_ELECO|nr:hypothetical protein PR202_ga06351 [Eleusine coracana subsp. coracana]
MAPGSRIVTEVPESDSGDDGISEALGSLIRLDGDSTHKPWSTTLANVALSSLSGLNDLLECPVCTNSMLPPILQVFKCFGQHFCLHFEAFLLGMAPVYVAFLRFMGEESEAQGFGYSLEVGGAEGWGGEADMQGTPRSIRDSHRRRDSYRPDHPPEDGPLLLRRQQAGAQAADHWSHLEGGVPARWGAQLCDQSFVLSSWLMRS